MISFAKGFGNENQGIPDSERSLHCSSKLTFQRMDGKVMIKIRKYEKNKIRFKEECHV